MTESERLPFDGLTQEVVRDAMAAIRIETAASAERSNDAVELTDGRPAGTVGTDHLWSFDVDGDLAPEPETPGTLLIPDMDPLDVRVLAVGDLTLVLGVRHDLGDRVQAAKLTLDAAFVYESLRNRLDDMLVGDAGDTTLVDALLMPDRGDLDDTDAAGTPSDSPPDADDEQARAASRAIEPGLRFTWGPPGTGKTRVLAKAAAEAARRGDRVLVLAHANAAVDVATARIADELAGDELLESGRVLRVGTPHLPDVIDRTEVLPASIVARQYPDLARQRDQLADERRRLSDELRACDDELTRDQLAKRLDDVRSESDTVAREIKQATRELVDDAQLIATTLSRAVIDDQLWSWQSDVVIVDEASMAGLPFVLALALRGASTLSLLGDFRQLPPIAVAPDDNARRWFATDVFEYAAVIEAHETGRVDQRLSVLRTQFRMGEQICETINDFAYNGLLRTHQVARNRGIRLAELAPSPGSEVLIVDTSELHTGCSIDRERDSYSRLNLLSAAVTLEVAAQVTADECDDVGLISPYRAQTRLLEAATRSDARIEAATIHRFQGSERDAIVFDVTDGFDQPGPSRLTGNDGDIGRRLFNVAASRARGKLIVIADTAFIEERHPLRSPARQLIEAATDAGAETVAAAALVSDVPPLTAWAPTWSDSWSTGAAPLVAAAATGSSIDINVVDLDHGGDWLVELAKAAPDPSRITVRAPFPVARELDGLGVDLQLLPAGGTPWAIVDETTITVGSLDPEQPVAHITGAAFVRAVRKLLTPQH